MKLFDALKREPVLLGAAISGSADGVALLAGASTTAQTIIHGITLAWVAWAVRLLSTSAVKADEHVQAATAAARNEALADVASLIPATKAEPARKASANKAPAKRRDAAR